jgi:ankyrin repeat protein
VCGDREQGERILADHPEAVNETDEYGFTALHTPLLVLAAEPEREDAMAVLLEAGANVNATPLEGYTALDIAIDRGEHGKADLLRRYGAKRGQSV